MKKSDFIKLIRECMQEAQEDPTAILAGGDESDAGELSTKDDVIEQIDNVVKAYLAGEKIEKNELINAAAEEQTDASRLYVSDILFERIKNIFYNHQQMKAVTFMGTNMPAVKDAIIAKTGANPLASTVVHVSTVKGADRYQPHTGETGEDDEITSSPEELAADAELDKEPTNAQLTEKIKKSLRNLIKESLEEIKVEKETETVEVMEEILKEAQKHVKTAEVVKTPRGNFFVEGCGNHHFDIRPMWEGNYDVVYFKSKSDREKKFGMDVKTLKEYIKAKLTNENTYLTNTFNRVPANQIDQVKKVEGLPDNNKTTIKKIGETKNENKDFNEKAVLNEDDQPDKPMVPVKKVVKQVDHPVAGEKVKFTPPKQEKKDKAHLVKLKNKKLKA